MIDATVVIATFGEGHWRQLAKDRAVPSVGGDAPVVIVHGDSLAKARNEGLERIDSEWVVFLDADDELTPGYLEAMSDGHADMRAPSVEYVKDGKAHRPYVPKVAGHRHDCVGDCLTEGNWLVIGTAIKTDIVREVGGFREWDVYEDWDLFLRCYLAGASVEAIPQAVYRAHVREDSRNRAPSMDVKNRVHMEIVRSIG